jgi:hypothetical protein
MLATWLLEFFLGKCNELDDVIASESVSGDTENLQTEKTILEDDLRHFLEAYKVCRTDSFDIQLIVFSTILTKIQHTNLFKAMVAPTCVLTMLAS